MYLHNLAHVFGSGYCPMQVYHRYVLGLYRIFEARMNCDRVWQRHDHLVWSLSSWPVMGGDHFQLSARPLWELCVCDLSENMDELNRFQMEVKLSSAWFVWIFHTLNDFDRSKNVRRIVMLLHSAELSCWFLKGQEVDDLMLRFWPGVHRCTIVDCWHLLTTFRMRFMDICSLHT